MSIKDLKREISESAALPPVHRMEVARSCWAKMREIEGQLMRTAWTRDFNDQEFKELKGFLPELEAHLNRLEAAAKRRK